MSLEGEGASEVLVGVEGPLSNDGGVQGRVVVSDREVEERLSMVRVVGLKSEGRVGRGVLGRVLLAAMQISTMDSTSLEEERMGMVLRSFLSLSKWNTDSK